MFTIFCSLSPNLPSLILLFSSRRWDKFLFQSVAGKRSAAVAKNDWARQGLFQGTIRDMLLYFFHSRIFRPLISCSLLNAVQCAMRWLLQLQDSESTIRSVHVPNKIVMNDQAVLSLTSMILCFARCIIAV